VGGGGLISGIAGCVKARAKDCKVIGCQPQNDNAMQQCIERGEIFDIEVSIVVSLFCLFFPFSFFRVLIIEAMPTLSDGTAGNIEPGSITFEICKKYVFLLPV
jgi:threonine dehydratase